MHKISFEKDEYNKACIRFAQACHNMSAIYERFAEEKGFENTRLSGLDLALQWERLALESQVRHRDIAENIASAENNITRILAKIEKYKEMRGDNA